MLITSYILKKVRIHKNCPQINLKYQRTDAFFSIFHIWVCNKETCYFLEQNDFEGFYITGTFRWSGMIKTKGKTCSSFANYWRLGKTRLFNLYRSRLYIPYFQTSFMPFRSWILFGFQPRTLFPFFTFHDEKLTRLNVRKNIGLKCEV